MKSTLLTPEEKERLGIGIVVFDTQTGRHFFARQAPECFDKLSLADLEGLKKQFEQMAEEISTSAWSSEKPVCVVDDKEVTILPQDIDLSNGLAGTFATVGMDKAALAIIDSCLKRNQWQRQFNVEEFELWALKHKLSVEEITTVVLPGAEALAKGQWLPEISPLARIHTITSAFVRRCYSVHPKIAGPEPTVTFEPSAALLKKMNKGGKKHD